MTTARSLRQEARGACENRAHDMKRFVGVGKSYRTGRWNWWHSSCRKCGLGVDVMTNPQPNQVNIGGPAVAEDCHEGG